MNNFTDKIIHSHPQSQWFCICGFELLTLLFARFMQSTVQVFISKTALDLPSLLSA